jgi:hypothetical protein
MPTTTDRTKLLINFVRGMLLGTIDVPTYGAAGTTYFVDNNYTPAQLTRRNSPQAKDPQNILQTLGSLLIFSWDPDKREPTTDIDHGVLTIQVYTNTYTNTEQVGNALADALHLLTTQYTDPETGDILCLYRCHDQGGPAEPVYNSNNNTWSTACSFKIRVG